MILKNILLKIYMILSNGQLTVTKSVRDERASVNQGVKQLDYELLVLIVSVTILYRDWFSARLFVT